MTENTKFLETKLVSIMEDFELSDDKSLVIEKKSDEGSLILVSAKSNYPATDQIPKEENNLPNWTVSPYDLGGHSPYFSSHKIFATPSSFFFMIFSRLIDKKS